MWDIEINTLKQRSHTVAIGTKYFILLLNSISSRFSQQSCGKCLLVGLTKPEKGQTGTDVSFFNQQECIPVGCVPPAHWPGGVLHPGEGFSIQGGFSIRGGSPSRGGVPCDLSHHAFDVTCMLPSHQLCTCLYTAWSCDLQCILGYPPPPVDRQTPVKT